MKTVAVAGALLVLWAAPLARAADQGALWRAYAAGPPARRQLLEQCRQRLDRIKAKARQEAPPDWATDEDVRWLLAHRIPAVLAVEEQLQREEVPDGYLVALVDIARLLGHRRLLSRMPRLLQSAETTRARRKVLKALGDLGTPEAVVTLREFLKAAGPTTPDELIGEAARGLGLARDGAHLPLLGAAARQVQSPMAKARVTVGLHRCGAPAALAELLEMLRSSETPKPVRLFVLQFLEEERVPEAVPLLAEMATGEADAEVTVAALRALMSTTGYRDPPAAHLIKPWDEGQEGPTGPGEDESARRLAEMSPGERDELVEKVLRRWRRRLSQASLADRGDVAAKRRPELQGH
jgi:HEAT repeat protein